MEIVHKAKLLKLISHCMTSSLIIYVHVYILLSLLTIYAELYFFVDQLTDMASDTDLVKELYYKFCWLKVIIPVSRKLVGMGGGANVPMVKTVE